MNDTNIAQAMSTRRTFLGGAAVAAVGSLLGGGVLSACGVGGVGGSGSDTISVGSLQDQTGGLEIYGDQQFEATKLAIDDINAAGGLLGKKLSLNSKNTQSDDSLYAQYARTLLQQDHAKAVVGALASSSREAMRPVFDQNNGILFYPALYEGGVCDRNVFLTGPSASQQIKPLIEYALQNLGKTFYIVAPNYNYGTISTTWYKKYVTEGGGQVLGAELLPLSTSNFATTISHIQAKNPEVVVALPVGSSQTGFFAQFANAGLKDRIAVISTNYGSGNQQVAISPEAGNGIIVCLEYVPNLDNPYNKKFMELWAKKFKGADRIIDEAVNTWTAWHLWAEAVKKAGSTDTDAVIKALQSGIQFNSPGGPVTLDGATHHLIRPMYIAKGNKDHGFDVIKTIPNVKPTYEETVCNLIKNPDVKKQFTPNG